MEENIDDVVIVPIKDLEIAKDFYGNKLGLTLIGSDEEGIHFKYGDTRLVIYKSDEEAGAEQETLATWRVNDLPALVANLKAKGVNFEHYTMRNVTVDGDIHTFEDGVRCVWFTDPDGNIFEVDEAK